MFVSAWLGAGFSGALFVMIVYLISNYIIVSLFLAILLGNFKPAADRMEEEEAQARASLDHAGAAAQQQASMQQQLDATTCSLPLFRSV